MALGARAAWASYAAWLSELGSRDQSRSLQNDLSGRHGCQEGDWTRSPGVRPIARALKHPLSEALPVLSAFLDPPNEAQPGDVYQPRVARPGFGASDRFVVAPGQEKHGHFPHADRATAVIRSAPYYNLGHEAWMKGQPTPFLPGEAKWQLYFQPE